MGQIYTRLEDVFIGELSMKLNIDDRIRYLEPLIVEGRTEKSLCFAIWRSRDKLNQYKRTSKTCE